MSKKLLRDDVILRNVMNALNLTKNKLSIELGYKSPVSVYNVFRDDDDPRKQPLSTIMSTKIIERFPNVSYKYLTKGEEPVLLEGGFLQSQTNIVGKPEPEKYSLREHLERLEAKQDRIEHLLLQLIG